MSTTDSSTIPSATTTASTPSSSINTSVPNPTKLPNEVPYDLNENLSRFFGAFGTLFSKFGEFCVVLVFGLPSDSPAPTLPPIPKSAKIIEFNYREFFGAFITLGASFIMAALIYRIFVSLAKII
jgi:hypothetical protein